MQPHSLITSRLVAQLTPTLRRTARRELRREQDAEDAVQEMWLSALNSAAGFQGNSSLSTWLTRILKRRIVDHHRRDRPREPLLDESLITTVPFAADGALELVETATALQLAMASLTPLERAAVGLCDLQELEREQAAERLCIAPVNLRVVLHRARRKLSSRLREHRDVRSAVSV